MENEAPHLDRAKPVPLGVAESSTIERLGSIRTAFIAGTVVSLLGFVLPWFKTSASYLWWYSGWELLTTNQPDLAWTALLFVVYALLLLAGYFLPRFGLVETICLGAGAIGIAFGTLIIVALAAADGVESVYRIKVNIGLLLLAAGHGTMIAAAITGIVVQAIRAALIDFAVLRRD